MALGAVLRPGTDNLPDEEIDALWEAIRYVLHNYLPIAGHL